MPIFKSDRAPEIFRISFLCGFFAGNDNGSYNQDKLVSPVGFSFFIITFLSSFLSFKVVYSPGPLRFTASILLSASQNGFLCILMLSEGLIFSGMELVWQLKYVFLSRKKEIERAIFLLIVSLNRETT